MTQRDNSKWLEQLRDDGPSGESALSDLRASLLRGLRAALSNRPLADDAFLEDTVQDSLLRILDRLDQFQGRSRFLTWATSIAVRVALTELRRRRWRDVSLDELLSEADYVPDRAVDEQPSAGARWEQRAILDKMHQVIRDDLTERQRAALLAELKGMPQDEIARHLDSNRNAVYKLTHDARKRLKAGLEAAGYAAEDIHAAFSN